jgi:FKBP-type peptidyl-prolyl cis-trans isomerase SlyD
MVFRSASGLPEEFERQLDGKKASRRRVQLQPQSYVHGEYDESRPSLKFPERLKPMASWIRDAGNFLPMADNQGLPH